MPLLMTCLLTQMFGLMVVSLPMKFLVLRLRGLGCMLGHVLMLGGIVGGAQFANLLSYFGWFGCIL